MMHLTKKLTHKIQASYTFWGTILKHVESIVNQIPRSNNWAISKKMVRKVEKMSILKLNLNMNSSMAF